MLTKSKDISKVLQEITIKLSLALIRHFLVLVVGLILVSPLFARKIDDAQVDFGATFVRGSFACKSEGQELMFAISGKSAVFDSEEKDFGSPYAWIAKPEVHRIPFSGVELKFVKRTLKWQDRKVIVASPGICGDVAGYRLNGDRWVLVVTENNRPQSDKIRAVFIDPIKRNVIAVSEPEATLHPPFAQGAIVGPFIVPASNGIRYRASSTGTDHMEHPVNIRGFESIAKEETFAYWMTISLVNDLVENKVDRELTWKDSPYRRFFKNRSEFEKAFGLKADFSEYVKGVFLFVVTTPHAICIQPAQNREPVHDEQFWNCAPLETNRVGGKETSYANKVKRHF